MNFSVTKNGKPVSHHLYDWNEKTKTFSTNENYLVLDFREIDGVTFKTGVYCSFKTGSNCIFKTGVYCSFKTGAYCIFNTGYGCAFKTGSICIFNTGSICIFNTGNGCVFKTGHDCTFKTEDACTFDTGYSCTFKTDKNCVVVRRDIFEVIVLEENQKIKLEEYQKSGFTYVKDIKDVKDTKTIIINGKECEISLESFENIQKEINVWSV